MGMDRGFTTVVNEDLTGVAIMAGCFICAVITSVCAMATGTLLSGQSAGADLSGFRDGCGIFGFLFGFMACVVVCGVVDASTKTVFVAWASAPDVLRTSHPGAFNKLLTAW